MMNSSTILLLLYLVVIGNAKPYFFLTSQVPKCVTVEVPSETFVHVSYDVPDLHRLKDPSGRRKQTILTISQPNVGSVADGRPRRKKAPTSTTVLENVTGKVMYKAELGGEVQVCIRVQGATAESPARVSLFVATGYDSAHYKHEEMEHHLSKLQVSVMKLIDDMTGILREADLAKSREVDFHNQSVSMHAASQWWPIVQICVLLATGFTQGSAIVRFFKSKRLV